MSGKKPLRWIVILIVAAFALIQLSRPARTNPHIDQSQVIESHVQVPPPVKSILDRSCNDCHSNKTRWPWYTNVAPVSWYITNHVNEGRHDMNFSEWGAYDKDKQSRRLRDICEQVTDGQMPLSSYTPLHPASKLSSEDVKTLCEWANAERGKLNAP